MCAAPFVVRTCAVVAFPSSADTVDMLCASTPTTNFSVLPVIHFQHYVCGAGVNEWKIGSFSKVVSSNAMYLCMK